MDGWTGTQESMVREAGPRTSDESALEHNDYSKEGYMIGSLYISVSDSVLQNGALIL